MTKKQSRAGLFAADVNRFLKLKTQMDELLLRMTAISTKAPDQVVNKFKVAMINEQLRIANNILSKDERPSESFETFDDAALPTNSDVVIVLSQYGACLEKWRSDHVAFDEDEGRWVWETADRCVIKAAAPTGETEE